MRIMIMLVSLLTFFGCGSPGKEFENDTIISFSLSEGGGMDLFGGFGYSVEETKDGRVHFLFNEGHPDEKEFYLDDHSVFDSLQQIVMKHKMYTYHGHYNPPFEITDGGSWSFYVTYKSKKSISAGGYMAGPKGYGEAFKAVMDCLDHWKNLPMPVNEVTLFVYDYGKEHYVVERKEDHAVMTYDNEETGEHQVLERESEMLEDLRITFNIGRLKMNSTRGEIAPDCTPWMYDITYSNGDHYRYESYDGSFQCGYTRMLQHFVTNWRKEKEERDHFNYY